MELYAEDKEMSEDTASKLTAERGKVYGHPLDDFGRVAKIKEVLQQCPDPEVRHALEMIAVKMCRLIQTPDHADSIDDIMGYAKTIHMIHAERKSRGWGWVIKRTGDPKADPDSIPSAYWASPPV
jgi:hypothetical protein